MVQQNDKPVIKTYCVVCGKPFMAYRTSAKYDSAACRQMAKRDIEMLWHRVYTIQQLLTEICRTQSAEVPQALATVGKTLIASVDNYKRDTRHDDNPYRQSSDKR